MTPGQTDPKTGETDSLGRERRQSAPPARPPPGCTRLGRVLTDGAGAALPAWGAGATEGVPIVVAGAPVAAGIDVALELACKHMTAQRAGPY